MSSFGLDFRSEALSLAGRPALRIVRGWRFLLSAGAPKTISKEEYEGLLRNAHSTFGLAVARTLPPTYEEYQARVASEEDRGLYPQNATAWMLSASLDPRDRPTSESDWEYLGAMAESVGAPREALLTPIELTDPSDVFYWNWQESK